MPETTPLIKAALNLRGGAGFDVYFHGDGYILQNAGNEVEEISFVVCDVNSEKERLQVDF